MVLIQLTRFLESLDDVMFLGTYFTLCKDPRTAHVTHGNCTWAVRKEERAAEGASTWFAIALPKQFSVLACIYALDQVYMF